MSYGYDWERRDHRPLAGSLVHCMVVALIGIAMYMGLDPNAVDRQATRGERASDQEGMARRDGREGVGSKLCEVRQGSATTAGLVEEVGGPLHPPSRRQEEPYIDNSSASFAMPTIKNTLRALPGSRLSSTEALRTGLEGIRGEALPRCSGHEIGHVINRHSAQQMAEVQLGSFLTVAVGSVPAAVTTQPETHRWPRPWSTR